MGEDHLAIVINQADDVGLAYSCRNRAGEQ